MERIIVNSVDKLVDKLAGYIEQNIEMWNKLVVFRCKNISEMTDVYLKLTERFNTPETEVCLHEDVIRIRGRERGFTIQPQSFLTRGAEAGVIAKIIKPIGRLQDFKVEKGDAYIVLVGVLDTVLLGNYRKDIDVEISIEE